MKMSGEPVMPEQIASNVSDSRMPTFEEFVQLYVHSNGRIPDVIDRLFCPNEFGSRRITPGFFEKLRGEGLKRDDIFPFAAMSEEAALKYVGPVVTFVPRGKREPSHGMPYFLISHPFEIVAIREKLSERSLHFAYGGLLETLLVKTICTEHPDGGYILAVLSGEANADWRKLGSAVGLSSNRSKRLHPYDGSLEEAVGMPRGKVGPLVTAERLHNLAYIVIDSGVERPKEAERASYLEIPLNIHTCLIKILRDIRIVLNKPLGIDVSRRRELSLAYNPKSCSLVDALKSCYGEGKVVVADIVN